MSQYFKRVNYSRLISRSLAREETNKLPQFSLIQIRDRPIFHFLPGPGNNVETPTGHCCGRGVGDSAGWDDEDVDWMFVALINERDNRSFVQVVEASADQRKPAHREIMHVRRVIDLSVEPRFDR